jgi:hypothetical protein
VVETPTVECEVVSVGPEAGSRSPGAANRCIGLGRLPGIRDCEPCCCPVMSLVTIAEVRTMQAVNRELRWSWILPGHTNASHQEQP